MGIFSAFVHGAKEGVKEGLTGRPGGSTAPRTLRDSRRTVLDPVAAWTKGGWPQLDIVGEHFHREELLSLAAPSRDGSPDDVDVVASLVPQPENQHDPHACAVYVDQRVIGYLSRDDARDYQPMLLRLHAHGQELTAQCHIHYYPSFDDDSETPKFESRARLELDRPWLCLPVNDPPQKPFALLPFGGAIQVRKEEEHMAALRPHLNEQGEGWAWATLHEIASTGRTPKPIVEVRIDQVRVGELTPAMSDHFLPTIRALDTVGKQCAVKCLVKGNALKVEVTLHGCKAHELPGTWIADSVVPVVGTPASPALDPSALIEVERDPSSPDSTSTGPAQRVDPPPSNSSGMPTSHSQFNPAPGWPEPPIGWTPPPGWQPAPDWPAPPPGWQFWL